MAALGLRARIALTYANSGTVTVTVGNPGPVSPLIQVVLNGVVIGEYSSVSSVDLPFVAGLNVLQLCVADGQIQFSGKVLGSLGVMTSLYTQGNDLFATVSGGSNQDAPIMH